MYMNNCERRKYNQCSLQEQYIFLTTEALLQPQNKVFYKRMANERTRTEFKYGIRTKISLEYVENKKDFPQPERRQSKDAESRGEKLMIRILEDRLDSSTLRRENSQTCLCVSVPACAHV